VLWHNYVGLPENRLNDRAHESRHIHFEDELQMLAREKHDRDQE
jgi:hypothetical protein